MHEFVIEGTGQRLLAEKLLGCGRQGQVWQAQMDGRSVAVKGYHQDKATPAQREVLVRLVQRKPPASCFLWPLAMVDDQEGSFGYVMEMRESRFRPLADFSTRAAVPTFCNLLTTCMQLADAFGRLHRE